MDNGELFLNERLGSTGLDRGSLETLFSTGKTRTVKNTAKQLLRLDSALNDFEFLSGSVAALSTLVDAALLALRATERLLHLKERSKKSGSIGQNEIDGLLKSYGSSCDRLAQGIEQQAKLRMKSLQSLTRLLAPTKRKSSRTSSTKS